MTKAWNEITPTSPSNPVRDEATHDTIPAPEVHPVPADVLFAWERGHAFHDTEIEAQAFREGIAFLIRQTERKA